MKRIALVLPVIALVFLAFKNADEKPKSSIDLGTELPKADLKMKDVSGKKLSFNDIKKDNGLLVVFSCNTCPFVVGGNGMGEGWEGRYNELKTICDKQNIGMVLVNSNEAKRGEDDSFEAMQKRAKTENYKMNYVVDANSVVANAFNAKTTPHVFLFNKSNSLVYKGAIDDNNSSATRVGAKWLQNALNELGEGKAITTPKTRNKGCSIKRKK